MGEYFQELCSQGVPSLSDSGIYISRVWELTVGVVAVGGVIPATGGVNGEMECEPQSDVRSRIS